MTRTPAEALIIKSDMILEEARGILKMKNHDYTSGSGDPFANFRGAEFLGINPGIGILLRMQDKMQRILTFIERGELKVTDEGLKDAVIDNINYSLLLYSLLTEDEVSK